MNKITIKNIAKYCKEHNIYNIYLWAHKNPDGDALGSTFALRDIFLNMGFNSEVIYSQVSNDFEIFPLKQTTELGMAKYIAIICDTATFEYIENDMWRNAELLLKIDHHLSGETKFFSQTLIKHNYSSTCELVAELLMADEDIPVTQNIVNYLYFGIITDTGKLSYALNKNTYKVVLWLIDNNADFKKLNRLYEQKDLKAISIIADILKNMKISYSQKYKTKCAIYYASYKKQKTYESSASAFLKHVNYMGNIQGVDIWCMIAKAEDNKYTVSIRSKEGTNINTTILAQKFNGGGHFHASGCKLEKEQVNNLLLELNNDSSILKN